jgi:hypothetical protein
LNNTDSQIDDISFLYRSVSGFVFSLVTTIGDLTSAENFGTERQQDQFLLGAVV